MDLATYAQQVSKRALEAEAAGRRLMANIANDTVEAPQVACGGITTNSALGVALSTDTVGYEHRPDGTVWCGDRQIGTWSDGSTLRIGAPYWDDDSTGGVVRIPTIFKPYPITDAPVRAEAPHLCPKCDGEKKIQQSMSLTMRDCPVCDGDGVLWR